MNQIVKVYAPYIRYVSPSKVLIGRDWQNAVRCDVKKLPSPPPYDMLKGVVELPLYVAREINT